MASMVTWMDITERVKPRSGDLSMAWQEQELFHHVSSISAPDRCCKDFLGRRMCCMSRSLFVLRLCQVRVASSRAYEICIFIVKMLGDFLELPYFLTSVFTWTIDCGYPKQTHSTSFCFAETKAGVCLRTSSCSTTANDTPLRFLLLFRGLLPVQVTLVNVPSDFGAEFKEWAYKTAKDRQQNRFILQSEDAHSSFDTVIARDAVEKSNGEWRQVCSRPEVQTFTEKMHLFSSLSLSLYYYFMFISCFFTSGWEGSGRAQG